MLLETGPGETHVSMPDIERVLYDEELDVFKMTYKAFEILITNCAKSQKHRICTE